MSLSFRIDSDGLKFYSDEISSMIRYTTEIYENLIDMKNFDSENSIKYLQCIEKAEMLNRCFGIYADLLIKISEKADMTIQEIEELLVDYMQID